MHKHLLTVVAAASMLAANIASPTRSEARCYDCWAGPAFGVLAGVSIPQPRYRYNYYRPLYLSSRYYGYYGPRYYYAPRYYGSYKPRYHYGARYR